MKKKIIISIISIILLLSIGALIYGSIVLNKNEKEENKHLIVLNYKELQEKISNKDSFILVMSRTDCSHCAEYIPVFKKVLAEYDIIAYQIEIDLLSKEEENSLNNIANISGTPTTIFIKDGEETNTSSRLVGAKKTTAIINRLKAMGYIKKDK